MAPDAVISRELKSLHQELSATQRQQTSPPVDPASVIGETAAQVRQVEHTAEEQQLHGTLGEFVDAIIEFVEEAEKNVSEHPVANVIGGIVVGVLIGRLLGRGWEP